jgi:hypothetical protein
MVKTIGAKVILQWLLTEIDVPKRKIKPEDSGVHREYRHPC